ncbi:MAG: extracellular solute-binding protein [Chloroflexota bacterium]
MQSRILTFFLVAILATLGVMPLAAQDEPSGELIVYSTRSEALFTAVLEAFNEEFPDIEVTVVRGSNGEMGARLLEEQDNPQADVFVNSDTLTMASLNEEGIFEPNDSELVMAVPEEFRADDGSYAALTFRGRVIMYNTELIDEEDLPTSLLDLADPQYAGMIGSADSTNGAMLGNIVALNRLVGEEATTEWIEGLIANETVFSGSHTDIRRAVGAGEVTLGLVNHYYYYQSLAEGAPVGIIWPDQGEDDIGLIVNSTSIGIINGTEDREIAEIFVDFMLSEAGQDVYANGNFEWPIFSEGIELAEGVASPDEFMIADIELKSLVDDLEASQEQALDAGLP